LSTGSAATIVTTEFGCVVCIGAVGHTGGGFTHPGRGANVSVGTVGAATISTAVIAAVFAYAIGETDTNSVLAFLVGGAHGVAFEGLGFTGTENIAHFTGKTGSTITATAIISTEFSNTTGETAFAVFSACGERTLGSTNLGSTNFSLVGNDCFVTGLVVSAATDDQGE